MCHNQVLELLLRNQFTLDFFPFSLHDRATAWLDFNASGSITSWESLLSKFYNKFFPMSRVNEAWKEISSFT
jgi:hypothetical protein